MPGMLRASSWLFQVPVSGLTHDWISNVGLNCNHAHCGSVRTYLHLDTPWCAGRISKSET